MDPNERLMRLLLRAIDRIDWSIAELIDALDRLPETKAALHRKIPGVGAPGARSMIAREMKKDPELASLIESFRKR